MLPLILLEAFSLRFLLLTLLNLRGRTNGAGSQECLAQGGYTCMKILTEILILSYFAFQGIRQGFLGMGDAQVWSVEFCDGRKHCNNGSGDNSVAI